MGIFIHMSISMSVTKKEWEKVYEETLQLVNAFPFAQRRLVKCKGIETVCLVPTVEREETYGWNNEEKRIGWIAEGDYKTMRTAEDFALFRGMIREDKFDASAGDAMLQLLPICLSYDWNDQKFKRNYSVWGGKTQREPYHMYLLAIACLIEARLGNKAFVYGDITKEQCIEAVELANKHLKTSIEIPDRCDRKRFCKRVSKLPISPTEQETIFKELCLDFEDVKYRTQKYKIIKTDKNYDINISDDLIYYKFGDSIELGLLKDLKQLFLFYDNVTKEDAYKKLMNEPPINRCKWLVEQNRSILIRDKDWNKIFEDIEVNENSFSRYYPMISLKINHRIVLNIILAIVLNDDLYRYCLEIKKKAYIEGEE